MKEMIRMCRMFYKESRYHGKTVEGMAFDFTVSKEVMTHFVEVGRIMEDVEYALYLKKIVNIERGHPCASCYDPNIETYANGTVKIY